jgi:FixJ family two-component response regulator
MTAAGKPVFVVDDDPSVRRALARLLRAAGYRVRTFSSALEFLECNDTDGACVVLDVRMPGITGLDLYDRLKEQERRVAVIFMTGDSNPELAARARAAGAVDVLPKPFDETALLAAIHVAFTRVASPSTLNTRTPT